MTKMPSAEIAKIKLPALRLAIIGTLSLFLLYAGLVLFQIREIHLIQKRLETLKPKESAIVEFNSMLIAWLADPKASKHHLTEIRQQSILLQNMNIKSAVKITDIIDKLPNHISAEEISSATTALSLYPIAAKQTIRRNIERNLYNLALYTGLFALGTLFLTWVFYREVYQSFAFPLNQLLKATEEIREGNLEYSLSPQGSNNNSLAVLMRNFNFMGRRLAQSSSRLEKINRLFKNDADKLTELSEQRCRFIRQLGHELRAPLSSISGFAEMIIEGYAGELTVKQEDYLMRIQRSSSHMLELVNDLVDRAKIQAGVIQLEYRDTPLKNYLMQCHEDFEIQAQKNGINFPLPQLDIPDTQTAKIDNRRLRQVLNNLLSNALKFTPAQGTITVEAKIFDGFLEIIISDTGIGMKPEEIESAFEEFTQLDNISRNQGAGLGLAICRQFINLHGGSLLAESLEGRGSSFYISLPLQPPQTNP